MDKNCKNVLKDLSKFDVFGASLGKLEGIAYSKLRSYASVKDALYFLVEEGYAKESHSMRDEKEYEIT